MTIGGRIASLLRDQGITQAELSKASGLTPAAISQFCSSQRVPTAPSLTKLALALGVSVDYLLLGDQKSSIDPDTASLLRAWAKVPASMKKHAIRVMQALGRE